MRRIVARLLIVLVIAAAGGLTAALVTPGGAGAAPRTPCPESVATTTNPAGDGSCSEPTTTTSTTTSATTSTGTSTTTSTTTTTTPTATATTPTVSSPPTTTTGPPAPTAAGTTTAAPAPVSKPSPPGAFVEHGHPPKAAKSRSPHQAPARLPRAKPHRSRPTKATPKLTAGPYVFPVYGPVWYNDVYGTPLAGGGWHHGDDIFAPLGAPVLAAAGGTLFLAGWSAIGGNRLWLRDDAGDYFYYAHLAAFSTAAAVGGRVQAGTIIGFVGDTGNARGTPPHLHFEVHPAATTSFGYDGAVNPTPYLRAWQRLARLRLSNADLRLTTATGWSAAVAAPTTPAPAAILLHSSDISTATGLSRKAVAKALAPPPPPPPRSFALRQELAKRSAPSTLKLSPQARRQALRAERLDEGAELPPGFPGATIWDALAQCEASGDWSADNGDGFYGGLQFTSETWLAHGGGTYAPYASGATREEQIAVAQRVLATQGWIAWPACSAKLGLR